MILPLITSDYAITRLHSGDFNMPDFHVACSIPKLRDDMNIDLRYLQNWLIANRLTFECFKS